MMFTVTTPNLVSTVTPFIYYYSKQLYFLQELLFQKMMFTVTTPNLVFTVTLFIYYYCYHYYYYYYHHHHHHHHHHYLFFYSYFFYFSGQYWTGLSIAKCKNSVFRMLIKISISVLNFSTKSPKETTIYDLLKITINIPLSTITVTAL